MAAQIKQFIDALTGLWHRDLLSDKVCIGFSSTASMHGGQASTLLAMYNSVCHFGGFIVTAGFRADVGDFVRNPYGATVFTRNDGSVPSTRRPRQLLGSSVAVAGAFKSGYPDM